MAHLLYFEGPGSSISARDGGAACAASTVSCVYRGTGAGAGTGAGTSGVVEPKMDRARSVDEGLGPVCGSCCCCVSWGAAGHMGVGTETRANLTASFSLVSPLEHTVHTCWHSPVYHLMQHATLSPTPRKPRHLTQSECIYMIRPFAPYRSSCSSCAADASCGVRAGR